MSKQVRVWTGTQWDTLAVTLPDLSNYSTTTQMNTAIGSNAGLNLLSTQNVSSSAGVSFTNFINSTYTHYRLVFSLVGSSVCNILFRARVNTTDVTTGYYGANWSVSHTGSSTIVNQQNTSSYNLINTEDSTLADRRSIMGIDLSTSGNLISFGGSGFSGRQLGGFLSGGICLDATSPVTGFTIFPSTGTMSGTIALYGYRKS